jgi:glucose-6-phosphate 1-dehydrogenase
MPATLPATSEAPAEFAGKVAGPCVFVLFGASGDLTKRKLIPALFNLVNAKLLPDTFAVMGVSVDDLDVEAFRKQVSEFLPTNDPAALDWLRSRLFY